jgi:hypothetical protein
LPIKVILGWNTIWVCVEIDFPVDVLLFFLLVHIIRSCSEADSLQSFLALFIHDSLFLPEKHSPLPRDPF